MKVWLVTIGEPVPVDSEIRDRLHRTGLLAFYLAQTGHEVVWWTSSFDHFRKHHLFARDTTLNPVEGLTIRLMRGCGYRRNISLLRLFDQKLLARKFSRAAAGEPVPDVVVAALPVIELCLAAVKFGERARVPVVLDMRDMWPDIFPEMVPRWARSIVRIMLSPQFWDAQAACSKAAAITGITEPFVEWGLARGNRSRTPLDKAFPLAHVSTGFDAARLALAEAFWDDQLCSYPEADLKVCFMGGLSHHLDVDTIIDAAALLHQALRSRVLFIICGTGDQARRLRTRAADLPNVIFPGWVDGPGIHVLQRRCQAGLDPLPNRFDFLATVNNKAVDYLSAGLPIISSPGEGLLANLISARDCGLSYSVGDSRQLADILERMCREPLTLHRMSANAKALFAECFAADLVHQRIVDYLGQVIKTNGVRLADWGAHPRIETLAG